jgi:Cu/Ag efflux protein CusF
MNIVIVCSAVLAVVSVGLPAPQGREAQSAAHTLNSTPVTLTATIEAIDQTNRVVTLKGPAGNMVDAYVPDTYKRFTDLKVGDQVNAQYSESLAVNIRKPGDPAPTGGVKDSVTPRASGPGATAARQVTASVSVTAVDPAVPSITVKGPKGNVISMRVQDAKRLSGIKPGDTLDVTYTQALLIAADRTK